MTEGASEERTEEISVTYFAYVFIGGFGLVITFVLLGYKNANVFAVVLLGGAIQSFFRFSKQLWQNSLIGDTAGEEAEDGRGAITNQLLLYLSMCAVTLLWYGLGSGIRSLIT